MKVSEIVKLVENFAAPELQEDYDNAGLITGNGDWDCSGVLCCLDVTTEVIAEAVKKNCNLVLAHHPIVFRGLKKITGANYVENVLIEAIKKDVAIYAAHTNLDNILLGVSGSMAEQLGLKTIKVLVPKQKMLRRLITFAPHDKAEEVRQSIFAAGAGQIGNYSDCSFNSKGIGTFKANEGADPYVGDVGKLHQEEETKIEIVFPAYLELQIVKALVGAHPYEEVAYDIFTMENRHWGIGAGVIGELETEMEEKEFLNKIKNTFKTGVIRHTALRNQKVKKIALCGGSGAPFIKAARSQGADFYITADIKYHEFFDAEGKMVIADIGHYESEAGAIDLLQGILVKKIPTFAVLKTGVNTNPVQYFTGEAKAE